MLHTIVPYTLTPISPLRYQRYNIEQHWWLWGRVCCPKESYCTLVRVYWILDMRRMNPAWQMYPAFLQWWLWVWSALLLILLLRRMFHSLPLSCRLFLSLLPVLLLLPLLFWFYLSSFVLDGWKCFLWCSCFIG